MIGVNDHTLVTESDGRRWVTREPAIVYFHKILVQCNSNDQRKGFPIIVI